MLNGKVVLKSKSETVFSNNKVNDHFCACTMKFYFWLIISMKFTFL